MREKLRRIWCLIVDHSNRVEFVRMDDGRTKVTTRCDRCGRSAEWTVPPKPWPKVRASSSS